MHRINSLLLSTHPMPSISVSAFAVLFGMGVGMEAPKSFLVGLAVLMQQFSVGLSNDWLDLSRDQAVGRRDKPAAAGQISGVAVRNWSFMAGVFALASASFLGWPALCWMVLMLITGWSYNLGLKANALSVLPYAVGFGILPAFVTLSLDESLFPPVWIVTVAALLGISAHFANALPDLFDDKATGVRALPHLIGQRLSAFAIAATAFLASVILVSQAPNLDSVLGTTGLLATVCLAGAASGLSLRKKPPRVVFPLLIAASLVNVILLMLGTGSLST